MRDPGSWLDFAAPALCALCRGPPGALPWLCPRCASRLALIRGPLCLRCGTPRALPAPVCGSCPAWPATVHGVRAAAGHGGTAAALANRLAARGDLAAARVLGALCAAAALALPLPDDTVLVGVPSTRSTRWRRGYDPAGELAHRLARALARPVRRWLRRVRPDPGAELSAPARWRAVRGSFRAEPAVRGRTVLLVDVTWRSGATIDACARALRRRGAAAVWAVTATASRRESRASPGRVPRPRQRP
ncbi:MAG: double zinc ribbon domain-containing protein [Planctomycetota bacterium]|nr:double zinc ribbon domain-containing protein [Planctomycetota bacterium]